MGFDPANYDVHTLGTTGTGRLKHRIGLANPGRRAEKHLELAARAPCFLLAHPREQLVGVGTPGLGHCRFRRPIVGGTAAYFSANRSSARLSSSTLTRGSPRKPSVRPSACALTSRRTDTSANARALATRGTWKSAAATLMSGSTPLAEAVTRSTGTSPRGEEWSWRSAATRSRTESSNAGLVGPSFEPVEPEAS